MSERDGVAPSPDVAAVVRISGLGLVLLGRDIVAAAAIGDESGAAIYGEGETS